MAPRGATWHPRGATWHPRGATWHPRGATGLVLRRRSYTDKRTDFRSTHRHLKTQTIRLVVLNRHGLSPRRSRRQPSIAFSSLRASRDASDIRPLPGGVQTFKQRLNCLELSAPAENFVMCDGGHLHGFLGEAVRQIAVVPRSHGTNESRATVIS